MFKVLILVLVSFCFSLSLTKESNTSSCYYKFDSWHVDTVLTYMDADNKVQSISLKYGEVKLVPYLDNSISRGSMYNFSLGKFSVGDKLLRASFYFKFGKNFRDCFVNYTVFNPRMGENEIKACTLSTNTLYSFVGLVPGTTVNFSCEGVDRAVTLDLIEGAVISFNSSGILTQTAAAYFYLKNTTTQSQTVSYTAVTGRDTTIVCPANSITEVTYGANNTSVWIGSVKYDGVQLGDKIVIGSGDAVEKSQLNINSNSLTVYPNPCTGIANIQMVTNGDIRVFTLDGKLVQSYKNVNSIRTESLNNGVYIVSTKLRNVEQRRMITVVR